MPIQQTNSDKDESHSTSDLLKRYIYPITLSDGREVDWGVNLKLHKELQRIIEWAKSKGNEQQGIMTYRYTFRYMESNTYTGSIQLETNDTPQVVFDRIQKSGLQLSPHHIIFPSMMVDMRWEELIEAR